MSVSHIQFLSNSFSGHLISFSCLMSIKVTSSKLLIYLKYTLVCILVLMMRSRALRGKGKGNIKNKESTV